MAMATASVNNPVFRQVSEEGSEVAELGYTLSDATPIACSDGQRTPGVRANTNSGTGRPGSGESSRQSSSRRALATARRPLDPLRVPESVGLVQPTWLPYIAPSITGVAAGDGAIESCPVGTPRSAAQCGHDRHASGVSAGNSVQSSAYTATSNLRKKKPPAWSARHHVSESKDNRYLPRLQRLYFDDQPHSRCRGGVYQDNPGHRSRNFDVFCGAPVHQQQRDLRQRFERYPFLAMLQDDATPSEAQPSWRMSGAGNAGSTEEKSWQPISLHWTKHLRADRGDLAFYRANENAMKTNMSTNSDDDDSVTRSSSSTSKSGQVQTPKYSPFSRGLLRQFHSWCVNKFGSYVRLWRCLDTHCNMRVGQGHFLKGLQQLGYTGDAKDLFKVLNRDHSGVLLFYHFAPEAALAVAQLLHWARVCHGGLQGIGLIKTLDYNDKIRKGQFFALFKKKGFSEELAMAYAFELVDKDGDGYVSREEALVLDAWDYPEWLVVEADEMAAESFKRRLVEKAGGNTLLAWRYLDKSCSMRVSWHDFRLACRKALNGEDCSRLAAAWRALDQDMSGWLSLREFDDSAYEALKTFSGQIQRNYGSVNNAFPRLSSIAGKEPPKITQSEFRQIARKSNIDDQSISMIFRGLDVDGSGMITRQEVGFLEHWKVNDETKEEATWTKWMQKHAVVTVAEMSEVIEEEPASP